MGMRIKKTNLASVGLVTQHFINTHHWGPRLRSAKVFDVWPDIAGAEAAKYSQPVRLQGGVLRIEVTRADWATSLRYMETQLVANANRILGEPLVERIHVYVKR